MTPYARVRLMLLVTVIVTAVGFAAAQQTAIPPNVLAAALDDTVPVDPLITVGTLPNGLRYYIRENRQPQARAELRLVVNAGSVLEDEDQRGLAHFVEHMAFNGSLNFPKQDIGGFMQSLGMRFGAHVNANTSFDETVYHLQIPTSNAAVIDRSLLILEDWAQNVSFDPVEIEKERGVILEEWRLGLGASERVQTAQFPLMFKGSRYAERLPIGRPEIIQNATPARLKQFYTDWYRPDLMAVVAVGDFDKSAIEAQIRSRFSTIPRAPAPKPRPAYTVPTQSGTVYSTITDPETTTTLISVSSSMVAREQSSIGSYRQHMVERLFSALLSDRLDEIAGAPNAPFLRAQTGRGLFVRTAEVTTLSALVATGNVERSLTALFTEVDRVARFGFTATELSREKLNLQRGLQRSVIEKDKSPSGPLADEFVRAFTQAEPIPGIVYRVRPESALHAGDHVGRSQRCRQELDARPQPAGRNRRAGERPVVTADGCETGCGHHCCDWRAIDGLRRQDQHAAFACASPFAWNHRCGVDEQRAWHHRVAFVQWRPGRAQADDVQTRRDPFSSREPGRHLACERRGLHRR